MTPPFPPLAKRRLITVFALTGAFMTQLDATIANVALPHMQASTSASREQIAWVLTSYLIMAAIFTPLSGWLAERFGRKLVMVGSLIGFTLASMLCGMAANLDQLIAFRLLQGMMGAALLPISQAILLDINPPEKHGSAMAVWGMGAILGPIIGPLLGGWLTEHLSWRWVFYVNLPFGVLASLGLWATLGEHRLDKPMRLDLIGFGTLAIAIGALQLMLDRGQMLDWFESTEIWIEATVAGLFFYWFVVHTLTARAPFIRPALFRDSNYLVGNLIGFVLAGMMYGMIALVSPMMAELMGYPIELVGLVTAPRGVGTMIAMLVCGQLINRVDGRLLIAGGMALSGLAFYLLSGASLAMDSELVIVTGFLQGAGSGMMFVPVTTMIFTTLDPRYRNEGAALNTLIRYLGASTWISILQVLVIRNAETVRMRLSEGVRPDNPAVALVLPDVDFSLPETVARLQPEIFRQALMVSYIDTFWVLCIASLSIAPLVLLLRRSR